MKTVLILEFRVDFLEGKVELRNESKTCLTVPFYPVTRRLLFSCFLVQCLFVASEGRFFYSF